MNKEERILKLIKDLNEASASYYNTGQTIMSDSEWDAMYDELLQLEKETGLVMSNSPTQNVGFEVKSELEKVKHSHLMMSLDKTKDTKKLIEFAGNKDCILSLKMDGLTCLLTYENGELIRAETRGNAEIGEDITHNAKMFENIPLTIPYKEHFEVEGEAIITYKDFKKINEKFSDENKYKNPRNLASGSIRQFDSKIAKERHLRFICWKVPEGFKTFTEGFEFASKLGFDVVPYTAYNNEYSDINHWINLMKEHASNMSYPIDGLVMSYDDVAYGKSLGVTSKFPRHSIAFKFKEDEEETILRKIEYQVGKTGILTPVGLFDPVSLAGTTVEKSTLHNISVMEELKIKVGATITVKKANEIIPMIVDCDSEVADFEIPYTCPCCGGKTEIRKDNKTKMLYCTNPDCSAKMVLKLSHAASRDALNIDGLSSETIEKFYDLGVIKTYKDLYHLNDHFKTLINIEGFGRTSITKLLKAVEKSRKTTLARFLYSLNIPLIGKTASKNIEKFIVKKAIAEDFGGYETGDIFNYLMDAVRFENNMYWKKVADFGDKMAHSFGEFMKKNSDMISSFAEEFEFDLSEYMNKPEETDGQDFTGKTFVVTGSITHFKNRDALKNYIESHNGKLAGSVSKNTFALINNDNTSESSKNVKAKSLNVPILTIDEFLVL